MKVRLNSTALLAFDDIFWKLILLIYKLQNSEEMSNFILAFKRAILLTLLTQLVYWINRYFLTGVIDQIEFIFNRENMIFSLKILVAYFITYYMALIYLGNKENNIHNGKIWWTKVRSNLTALFTLTTSIFLTVE